MVFLAERLGGGPGLREGAVGGLQLLLEALGGAGGLREGPLEHQGVVAEAPELRGVGLLLGRGVRQLAPELPRLLLRGLQLALQLHELLGLVGAALRVLQRLLQPLRLLPEPLALRGLQLQLALRLLQLQPQPAPLLLPLLLVGVEERLVGCVAARGGRDEAGVGVGGEGEDDGEGLEEAVVVVVDVVHGEGAPEEVAGVSGVEVEEEEALCVGEEAFLVEGLVGELQAAPF